MIHMDADLILREAAGLHLGRSLEVHTVIGSTNDIRVHRIGDAIHGKAPIYQSEK